MTALHLLRLPIRLPVLMMHAREHRQLDHNGAADLGYLVHGLLARLCESPPAPFSVQPGRPGGGRPGGHDPLLLLAYARHDVQAFRAAAYARAAELARDAIVWDDPGGDCFADSRTIPPIGAGATLGFRLRVCPTERIGKHHPRLAHGAEVDPYHARVQRAVGEAMAADPAACPRMLKAHAVATLPAREDVYRDWLAARLHGAATLVSARLVAQRDAGLWRKGEPRSEAARTMYGRARPRHGPRRLIGRREAVFDGTLRVADADAFAALLARGVGRHRAFGFGMLLLRPA